MYTETSLEHLTIHHPELEHLLKKAEHPINRRNSHLGCYQEHVKYLISSGGIF